MHLVNSVAYTVEYSNIGFEICSGLSFSIHMYYAAKILRKLQNFVVSLSPLIRDIVLSNMKFTLCPPAMYSLQSRDRKTRPKKYQENTYAKTSVIP